MSAALMVLHRDSGGTVSVVPFAYRSGQMVEVIEEMANYIAGCGLGDSLWEGVAADHLRRLLETRSALVEAKVRIAELEAYNGELQGFVDRVKEKAGMEVFK
ncbi:MAG: hypothetical protein EKK55_08225 [Rhodocyclaceae bacterium]|nr:MAG: hypothetical protein EKK55_08225 [Rhodocyclaceae bacterium]